jgi:GNAT superfamily N-acetyltransferase
MKYKSKRTTRITAATKADVPFIFDLIRQLAEYEKLTHEMVATKALLRKHLFGPRPAAEAMIARVNGKPVGFALYFRTFSTFLALPGIWLEDLFVVPEYRRRGVGEALLTAVAKIAVQRRCGRLEWSVLDWNKPAIDFYAKLGATPMSNWTTHRVTGKALRKLAGK